jgi:polyvinyl alcohol dehydrogenase (cytochrome)
MRTVIPGALLTALACAVVACTSAPASPRSPSSPAPSSRSPSSPPPSPASSSSSPSTAGTAAWPGFDRDAARTGVATGLPAAGRLSVRWRARLDGAVYGQPLAVGHDVIAATENDSVYALNESTGTVVWRTHLGTPVPRSAQHGCGDIFPLGITGTPVYDQATGLVYAVAETAGYHFVLFGLAAADGKVAVHRAISLTTSHNNPGYDQQRPALTIDDGRVYATFGGLAGDCGPYVGAVAGIPVRGTGPQVTFQTPTSREGAIWGPGGPVVGPRGELWISIGNGAATSGRYDGSDSVTALSPALRRLGFFAPASWADDNANDLDLGSTQPALAAGNSALIMGKRGIGYLLSTTGLGGIGHQLAARAICAAFGAAAVDGATVYEPCSSGGLAAITVSAARREISLRWRGPAGTNGSPVVGGGAVWVTAYTKNGSGTLYELNPADGTVRQSIPVGAALPHFSSLALASGTAYVSTLDGVTAIAGALGIAAALLAFRKDRQPAWPAAVG